MDYIVRIIKSLQNSIVLIDCVSETVKNEIKRQGGGFLSMLYGALGALMLGNVLTGKGVVRARKGVVRAEMGYNNMYRMNKNL